MSSKFFYTAVLNNNLKN